MLTFEFKNFFNNPTPLLLEISRFLESHEAEYRILLKINDAETFLKNYVIFLQNI